METTENTARYHAQAINTTATAVTVEPTAAETTDSTPAVVKTPKVSFLQKHRTAAIICTAAAVILVTGAIIGVNAVTSSLNQLATPVSITSPAASATPAPSATKTAAAAAAAPTVGAVLTKAQAMTIRKNFEGNLHAYQMVDGSYVAVSVSQPLPANVVADASAKALAATNAAGADISATKNAATASIGTIQYEAGRSIILVTRLYSGTLDTTGQPGYFWAPLQSNTTRPNVAGSVQFSSAAAAEAAAKIFVAAQSNPRAWDIILAQ
ncbi:MAG: hypothetical protein JWO18_773 [Microbacteriaceae bacterium]|nr:hypothetical protein [Microbacteriaceae bacterium]